MLVFDKWGKRKAGCKRQKLTKYTHMATRDVEAGFFFKTIRIIKKVCVGGRSLSLDVLNVKTNNNVSYSPHNNDSKHNHQVFFII